MARAKDPLPPTTEVSERMRRVATRGTRPEHQVRKVVRRLGIRHTTRTDHLPGRPDLLLYELNVAVFVHGCFWHGCPKCFRAPKRNRRWWKTKVANNRKRDRRKSDHLRRLGYTVLTLMEHDEEWRIETRLRRFQ